MDQLRDNQRINAGLLGSSPLSVRMGGWHMSYFMSMDKIVEKLESISHIERCGVVCRRVGLHLWLCCCAPVPSFAVIAAPSVHRARVGVGVFTHCACSPCACARVTTQEHGGQQAARLPAVPEVPVQTRHWTGNRAPRAASRQSITGAVVGAAASPARCRAVRGLVPLRREPVQPQDHGAVLTAREPSSPACLLCNADTVIGCARVLYLPTPPLARVASRLMCCSTVAVPLSCPARLPPFNVCMNWLFPLTCRGGVCAVPCVRCGACPCWFAPAL